MLRGPSRNYVFVHVRAGTETGRSMSVVILLPLSSILCVNLITDYGDENGSNRFNYYIYSSTANVTYA